MAGLKRARDNGRVGGKKPGLNAEAKKTAYAALHLTEENKKRPDEQKLSITDMINIFHISRATYYRYIDFAKKSLIEMEPLKEWKKKGANKVL